MGILDKLLGPPPAQIRQALIDKQRADETLEEAKQYYSGETRSEQLKTFQTIKDNAQKCDAKYQRLAGHKHGK